MNDKDKQSFIFTDPYKTKELIWDAYTGFLEHYNNYLMLISMGRIDPIVIAGLNKYAQFFYEETNPFYEQFEKELVKEEIEKVTKIMEQDSITETQHFKTIRKFFNQFMTKTGIKNIVRDVQDIGETVLDNR